MEAITARYVRYEKSILQSLESNGVKHRSKASSGLWLGTLIGLSAILTLLREESSYSEICLLVGVTGFGLIISCVCLYTRLSMEKIAVKDFQVIYFLPAIITSMSYLLIANKGLLASVVWGLGVGSLGTWGVLQVMSWFPDCFTLGEATAVMHSCILFLMSAVTNLPLRYHLPPIHDTDITTALLQVGMLYVILICLLCGYFPRLQNPRYFYFMSASLLFLVTLPSLYIILDQNPITWGLFFIFGKKSKIILLVYWAICLLFSVFLVTYQILSKSMATTSTRKSFHLLAALVYIPGMIYDSTFLYLASGVIMGLFIVLELMRFLQVPPLGEALQQGFTVFVDEKDVLISLTPLYLFGGLSFPLWMPTNNLPLLPLLSGVLTVGVGDTAASMVGSKWGSHKWPGSEKTVEGTIACVLSQAGLICGLAYMGYVNSCWLLLRSLIATIIISLVEAHTSQVDNLALPLSMYICLTI
ncbi:hypothetical protein KM043_005288 [Ampulex compressa]|nr:hypothetical protein KM043_005288 [Ampulex compressa]